MNWVAFGCCALPVILGLVGLKQGVVKMIYHMAAFALALIITAILAPMVSKVVVKDSSPSVEKVKAKVISTLKLDEIHFDKTVSEDILKDLKLPEAIRKEIAVFNTKDLYEKMDVEDAKDYLATSIATIILQAIVYIFVFLVVWLLLFIAFQTLNVVDKVPVLHTANRLAGMLVGIVLGACVVCVFFVMVTALSNFEVGHYLMGEIERSKFLKTCYDNNPLNGGFVSLSSWFK